MRGRSRPDSRVCATFETTDTFESVYLDPVSKGDKARDFAEGHGKLASLTFAPKAWFGLGSQDLGRGGGYEVEHFVTGSSCQLETFVCCRVGVSR